MGPQDITRSADNCNCRNTGAQACPLQNKCMSKDSRFGLVWTFDLLADVIKFRGWIGD